MLVICTDCISQSLATSFMTMRLLYMMMNGVASIDSTMLARIGLIHSGGTRPLSAPERQQHEAELTGLRQVQPGAQRHPGLRAKQPASAATSTSLNSTGSVVSSSTSGHWSSTGASPASCRW
jgi:hypothetical protein